uniref:synaptogyrin-3 isoform X2 n=1 Tax=Callithrix jacchus TaxID=9483 RepID=UPI00159D42E2|nr:synaptogyrin-3 isoform X2 [Callithrix jacchus]
MEGASFGAGRAGAALDPVSFARRPQTLLRVASWVFSIAVFGPIVNEGYVNTDSGPELRCVFNGNAGACRFGVALGLGAFLACAAFLLLDVRFQQISSVRDRRRAVLLDLGFSGLWSFLWFVGFCFLTNQWQRTAPGPATTQAGDAARAAIAFSFFSILSWQVPATLVILGCGDQALLPDSWTQSSLDEDGLSTPPGQPDPSQLPRPA